MQIIKLNIGSHSIFLLYMIIKFNFNVNQILTRSNRVSNESILTRLNCVGNRK